MTRTRGIRTPIARAVAVLLSAGLVVAVSTTPSVGLHVVGPAAFANGVAVQPVFDTLPAALRLPGSLGWYSSNWAGYAIAGGPYRSVSGQWTVPLVNASNGPGFSALWIGVDGFSNGSLIQTGTEADVYGGTTHYWAWWEILPASAVPIRGLSIRPGDRITASIVRVSTGRWRVTIRDARSGSYATTRSYAGPGTSAEWIEEAPVVGYRSTPLAVHGPVVFDNVTVNGTGPHLQPVDGGAMIRRGVVADTPSAPDRDGNGFALSEQGIAPSRPAS